MKDLIITNASILYDGKFVNGNVVVKNGAIANVDASTSINHSASGDSSANENYSANANASASEKSSASADFFASATAATSTSADTEIFDATGKKLLPGFFDEHTHGCMGADFNLVTSSDEIVAAVAHYNAWGVTSVLPTVMTDSIDVMCKQLALCAKAKEKCDTIRGIHLEGPFLAAEYKGAMPLEFLHKPNYDLFMRLQEAARDNIRLITLSPELEGSAEFTRQLVRDGVRVSLGHSGASYEQTIACIEAGASSTTHTMNAMKLLHMHDPAILTAVLENDIYCEMISDGFHLHPPIVRLLLKTKGADKIIAITDSIMAAGFPDGDYKLGVNNVRVVNGDAKIAETGVRAGSTLTMAKALKNILQFTNLPLETVSKLLSANAPKMLGLYDDTGSIEIGKRADFVLLDSDNNVAATFVKGKLVSKTEESNER